MYVEKSPAVYAPQLRLLILALGLALFGTLVFLDPWTSAWVLVSVTIAVIAAWLTWSHPELGLLAISFFSANLIPRDQVVVSTGGFNLDPADGILVALLTVFIVRGLGRRTLAIPHWSITGPLVAFAGFALFSALYARFYHGVTPALVVGELRPAVYCAGCAIAAATLLRRQQLVVLLVGLFIIADLTAGAVIVHQFGSGDPSLGTTQQVGTWQISLIDSVGGGFGSVRVVPPGHVLMFLMANVAFAVMLRPPKLPWMRTVLAIQLALLGVGLLLTYTRAQWIASGIALLLICAFLPRATWTSLGRLLVVIVPVLTLSVWLIGSELAPTAGAGVLQAMASRITSLVAVSDTLGTDSLEWRLFEIETGTASLSEHPILGVGLGNDYREITLLQGEANGVRWPLDGVGRLTRWIHNSYLYVAVKMGVLALGALLWFCLSFLAGGARTYFRLPDGPEKFVVLAIVASFAGLLEWVFFEAHLMLPGSMMMLGLMVGIVAAMRSLDLVGKGVVGGLVGSRSRESRP